MNPFFNKVAGWTLSKKVQKECLTVNIFQHTFFSEHRSVTFTSYKRFYESNFQDLKVTLKCSHCILISKTPRHVQFASWHHLDFSIFFLNPFSTNVLLLYPLKTLNFEGWQKVKKQCAIAFEYVCGLGLKGLVFYNKKNDFHLPI